MKISHKIRLVPTKKQEEYFCKACGVSRFTYNWGLATWKELYEKNEKPSAFKLKKHFNSIKRKQFPWVYEVGKDCSQQPFYNLENAFQQFFRRVRNGEKPGFPKFKNKGIKDSFYISNDKIKLFNRQIRIPRLGLVKTRESLKFQGKIMGAVVSRRANRWFISIQVEMEEYKKQKTSNNIVGIDLGISQSATLSTGEIFQSPKPLKKLLKNLKRKSRQHSKKKLRSNNRKKSQLQLAKLHMKIADIRKDFTHKLTTKLCRENQAIGIEGLNVSNMMKNKRLARSIGDESWGELRRQLEYKSKIYDNKLVVFDKFYPSSKKCSSCGNIKASLSLSERNYNCENCGLNIDRDLNAAINLIPSL